MSYLDLPEGIVDAVLDTDAYNEIDDQFAIAYMLRSTERINALALYAAPFHNEKSDSYADGMERSYLEIKKILALMGEENIPVYRGETARVDENTTPPSEAVLDLIERSRAYTSDRRLYVIAIGAISNIARAIQLDPTITERVCVVWLGANGHHWPHNSEFNLNGDVTAARAVMGSGVPFVSLPCVGVVSAFTASEPELRHWLGGKSALCDYLVENTVEAAEKYAKGLPWTRVIWDVCAVAWLVGGDRFMHSDIRPVRLPTYEQGYSEPLEGTAMRYVYEIRRDALMADLFAKLTRK